MAINKVSLHYNAEELRYAVPITDVIAYYAGIDTNNSERKQIRCPFPDHKDQHPSAKIYHETNTCSCFACGQGGDIITLVRAIRQVDFKEACRILINDFNLNEYEYSNKAEYEAFLKSKEENKSEYIDYFPLHTDELKTIGIRYNGGIVINEYTDNDGDTVGNCNFQAPSVQKMWREDKETTEEWLIELADSTIDGYIEEKKNAEEEVKTFYRKYTPEAIKKGDKAWEDVMHKIATGEMKYESDKKLIETLQKSSPAFAVFAVDRLNVKSSEMFLATVDELLCDVVSVKEKLLNHIKERKEHEKPKFNDKFRYCKE